MQLFLSRVIRYERARAHDGRRLTQFAVAVAIWHEFTNAGIRPLVLTTLEGDERSKLEEDCVYATEDLEGLLGRRPSPPEIGSCVARLYFARDKIVETATRQVRELIKEARDEHEYIHLAGADYIPCTALVPHKTQIAAFNEWYMREFHRGAHPRVAGS